MKKAELKILERAWEAEVNAACHPGYICHLFQTRSKVAKKLEAEGYLNFAKVIWRGVRIEGFELTHLGRMTYCATCD